MEHMEPLLIFKALSNETRSQIMMWLKTPEEFFDEKPYLQQGLNFQIGICVGDIQAKAGLAQSVISSYLLTMQKLVCWNLSELGSGRIIVETKRQFKSFPIILKRNYRRKEVGLFLVIHIYKSKYVNINGGLF